MTESEANRPGPAVIEASCHCGAIRLRVPDAPSSVTDCNCSICRRYGALWTYYRRSEVRLEAVETPQTYAHGDRTLAFHRCPTCGCVTHWSSTDPEIDRIGVNARLMPPEILSGSRIRRFDGAESWTYLD